MGKIFSKYNVIAKKDLKSVPEVEIRLENHYRAVGRLWPNDFQPFQISSPICSSYTEAEVITL